jgi:hypothetical protein
LIKALEDAATASTDEIQAIHMNYWRSLQKRKWPGRLAISTAVAASIWVLFVTNNLHVIARSL